MSKEKKIDEIRRLAAESGLSLPEVFMKANVLYSTVGNWDRKEPEAFAVYDRLKETIEEMKTAKKSETVS